MSEQSQTGNSQVTETPQQHERAMEDRILSLLDPQPAEKTEKTETQEETTPAESASTEDSKEQTEVKAEEEKLPEVEDVEYEGKQYKLPKELKEAILRQQDYTRKTQETAEVRKNAETVLQQAQRVLELQNAQRPIFGKIAALEEQIAQYERVDWNALTAQDATRAQQLFIAFQQAKDAKLKAEGELKTAETQMIEAARQARFAKLEEGHKALVRDIKGWNADLGRKIMTSTNEAYGAPLEVLQGITEPWAVRALNDARLYRELQASKTQLEKKAPAPQQTLKPKASEQRSPQQESYDSDRRALRSAKNSTEMSKAAERLILRKL